MANKDTPVFPFKVDVPSFPERKWLRSIRFFVYITCINLAFAILFAFLLLFFSDKKTTIPVFLYFSNSSNRFEKLEFLDLTQKDSIAISQTKLLEEQFIKSYLEARYNVSTFMADNNYKWCNCLVSDSQQQIIRSSYTKRENIKCSLCLMSASVVYSNFATFEKPTILNNFQQFGASSIEIKNIKKALNISKNNSGNMEYTIYEVDILISYEYKEPVIQKIFMGISKVEQLENNKDSITKKDYADSQQPYLFKIVSFSTNDFVKDNYNE